MYRVTNGWNYKLASSLFVVRLYVLEQHRHASLFLIPKLKHTHYSILTNYRHTITAYHNVLYKSLFHLVSLDSTKHSEPEERVLRLASPVISASVQCDNCTISNLTNPVEVTFTHSRYDMVSSNTNGWELLRQLWYLFIHSLPTLKLALQATSY